MKSKLFITKFRPRTIKLSDTICSSVVWKIFDCRAIIIKNQIWPENHKIQAFYNRETIYLLSTARCWYHDERNWSRNSWVIARKLILRKAPIMTQALFYLTWVWFVRFLDPRYKQEIILLRSLPAWKKFGKSVKNILKQLFWAINDHLYIWAKWLRHGAKRPRKWGEMTWYVGWNDLGQNNHGAKWLVSILITYYSDFPKKKNWLIPK